MDARLVDDDGAFWMSFEDFIANFYSINVCMVRQPKHGSERLPWFDTRERFSFNMLNGPEGMIVSAPSYLLTLHERNEHVYVSVHQRDTRCVGSGPYIDIGVTVLQITPDTHSGYTLIASTGNSSDRQNQTEGLSLNAGQYLVMPTSTGCKLRKVLLFLYSIL